MHKVPISHIHRCHLLDYEHQIVSVVLSHCHYSLKVGEAHNVQYDNQALEKHILDKFIHGKPMIVSDILQVAYRKDIYTKITLKAVRKMVEPQVSYCFDNISSAYDTIFICIDKTEFAYPRRDLN